jgi:hypothetical protein
VVTVPSQEDELVAVRSYELLIALAVNIMGGSGASGRLTKRTAPFFFPSPVTFIAGRLHQVHESYLGGLEMV